MRDISLPAPVTTGSTITASTPGVPGVIADPPPSVAQLDNGTILRGEVIGRDKQGQLLVRTDAGVLPISTKAKIPVGSQVTIQIRSAGSELHIAILHVEARDAGQRGIPRGDTPPASGSLRAGGAPGPQDQVQISGSFAASKGIPGTVSNAPPSASRLTNGARLQAQVLGQDHSGQLLVRTELGTLRIATEAAPPKNAVVILQVRNVVPQLNVIIAQADADGGPAPGQVPTQASGAQLAGSAPSAGAAAVLQGGQGHAIPTADFLTVGQKVTAQVIAAQAAATSAAAAQAAGNPVAAAPASGPGIPGPATPWAVTPRPGSEVLLQIIRVDTPPGAAAAHRPQISAAAAGGAQQPPGAPAVTNLAGPAAQAPAIVAADVGPHPARPGPPAAPSAAPSGQVTATVVGTTPAGQPLVDTPIGRLALGIQAQLPPGTQLVAQILTGATAPGPTPGLATEEPVTLPYAWPALEEAIDGLHRADPALGQTLLSADGPGPALPQPGPRLASSILFFLSALTGGDPAGWLNDLAGGQMARMLQRSGQSELRGRLILDLGQLGRYADGNAGDWRLFALPLFDGHHLHQLRLFLRHGKHRGRGDGADPEEATRFVLEVELSRMGELQLDGLVRQKRFDLILRSRQPLDPRMREDIAAIYQGANEAAGYSGQISFQASSDWPPMPVDNNAKDLAGLLV